MIGCLGAGFFDIPTCAGFLNLDNLFRMLSDISQLVYTIFSLIPGMCSLIPFWMNMWMLGIPKISLK